jgi:Sensors of blue-light using FAD
VFALVYVSTATIRWSDTDLDQLLQQSRRDNLIADITGLLLFKDGNFMQILEGPKDAVTTLLAKIRRDTRHECLMVIFEEETSHREFKDWSMGFKKVGSGPALAVPGFSDFLDLPLTSEQFSSNPTRLLQFLIAFKKSVQ